MREVNWRDEILKLDRVERLHDMGEEEPVKVHHHWQEYVVVLGNPERHDRCIVGFLHGAHVHLQPAGVPLLEGIGVFCPDVPAGPE